jgi:hypothetical protein
MRSPKRISKPEILVKKDKIWLEKILLNPNKRPGTHTYRHDQVLDALLTTGFHKCFYCETLLKGVANEVDHHIEVDIDRTLSVTWENLYLACVSCNDKLNHNEIPVTEALDPCRDTDSYIQKHIYFEDEVILPRNNSELGRNTIKKYKLGSKSADLLRGKELTKFLKIALFIQKECMRDGRKISKKETELIKSFTYIEKAYSLMFIDLLRQTELVPQIDNSEKSRNS